MPKMKSNRGAAKTLKKQHPEDLKEKKLTRAIYLLLNLQKEKEA